MANSKTLIVYVFALIICGSSLVTASTAPILSKDAVPAPPLQYQMAQPQLHEPVEHQQQRPQYNHQKVQEDTLTSSESSSSPASHPLAAPRQPAPVNNAPTTYSIKNGFGFSAGNSRSGPYTNGYGYVQGRTLQSQPEQVYMTDYDLIEQPRPSRLTDISFFSGFPEAFSEYLKHGLDFKQIFGGMLLGYGANMAGVPGKFSGFFPGATRFFRSFFDADPEPEVKAEKKSDTINKKTEEKEEKYVIQLGKKEPAASNSTRNSTSTRRKRDVEIDTDLTELATMVLAAIQSGECMQRSICLLGSQIGASSRGRAAFTLVDKLVPESVQGNQYFVTLKKALRGGETFCDRFRCRLN